MMMEQIERCPRCQGLLSLRVAVQHVRAKMPIELCTCALEERIANRVRLQIAQELLTTGVMTVAPPAPQVHLPDEDLVDYLHYNSDSFTYRDIANVHALVPGHNDDDNWHWIIELKDGRFLWTTAWCDYTGWDCQSGGESTVALSAEAAALLAPEREEGSGRAIRQNLLGQLRGSQPFGLEVAKP